MGNVNSHIQVPNAILKQFRDEEDPEKKVWYLDLATGEVKRSASGKLGTEKGYYSEGIEQFWSATIESPIAALNARIRKSCDGCEGSIGDFLFSEKAQSSGFQCSAWRSCSLSPKSNGNLHSDCFQQNPNG